MVSMHFLKSYQIIKINTMEFELKKHLIENNDFKIIESLKDYTIIIINSNGDNKKTFIKHIKKYIFYHLTNYDISDLIIFLNNNGYIISEINFLNEKSLSKNTIKELSEQLINKEFENFILSINNMKLSIISLKIEKENEKFTIYKSGQILTTLTILKLSNLLTKTKIFKY